jgi:hypothetical protein
VIPENKLALQQEYKQMKSALGSLPLGMIMLQLAVSMANAAEEMSAEIIAAQIRDQGYACDKALSAERDGERSHDAVWILKCQNATYRVRLIPDMAAKVEPLH